MNYHAYAHMMKGKTTFPFFNSPRLIGIWKHEHEADLAFMDNDDCLPKDGQNGASANAEGIIIIEGATT